jgi:hypothetical protein
MKRWWIVVFAALAAGCSDGNFDIASAKGDDGSSDETDSDAHETAFVEAGSDSRIDDTRTAPSETGFPSHCSDGLMDFDETDVDCGGSCMPCYVGSHCLVDADCASRHCVNGGGVLRCQW